MSNLDRYYHIIKHPVVTEKGSDDTATRNAYHFRVPVDANKIEIKQAIETLFNVKVEHVRVINVRGKMKRFNQRVGKRPDWKKAMVTLAEGQTIDVL